MSEDEKGDKFDFTGGDFRRATLNIKSPMDGDLEIRIPFQRPPPVENFINREEVLAKLLEDLKPGRVVTISGPAGIGKSALASTLIWTLRARAR